MSDAATSWNALRPPVKMSTPGQPYCPCGVDMQDCLGMGLFLSCNQPAMRLLNDELESVRVERDALTADLAAARQAQKVAEEQRDLYGEVLHDIAKGAELHDHSAGITRWCDGCHALAALAEPQPPQPLRHLPPRGMDEPIAWECQRCFKWIKEPAGPDDFCEPQPKREPAQ